MRFTISLLLAASLPLLARANDWKPLANEDGVEIFTRETPSGLVDLKAVGLVDASPETVFAMVTDVASYPKTMPYTETSRVLRRDGNVIFQYAVVSPPVVSRRDYCLKITLSKKDDGTLVSEWTSAPEAAPPVVDGVVRVTDTSGSWTIESAEGGKARVTYVQHSDPAGWIPRFMVNGGTKKTALETFKAVRKAVALPEYRNARNPLTPEANVQP